MRLPSIKVPSVMKHLLHTIIIIHYPPVTRSMNPPVHRLCMGFKTAPTDPVLSVAKFS